MKVLFVHDCAHTCEDLATELNKIGVETKFIGLSTTPLLALRIRREKTDIVHANYIKSPAYAAYLSGKRPYVLHAHGDDVRYGLSVWKNLSIRSASFVFCSTRDIEGKIPGSKLLRQPVNTVMFKPEIRERTSKKVLCLLNSNADPRLRVNEMNYVNTLQNRCMERGLLLLVNEKRGIPYQDMPRFLSQFAYFVDVEHGPISKTALECMAMKIPVLKSQSFDQADTMVEERYNFVMQNHAAAIVAKELSRYYQDILEARNESH